MIATSIVNTLVVAAAEGIPPDPPRSISLAAEIILIVVSIGLLPMFAGILWMLRKLWLERGTIYANVDAAKQELEDRIDATKAEADAQFEAGERRFAKVEQDLAEVKASLKTNDARTADGHRTIAKIEQKVDRLDERMDDLSIKLASSSSKMEQAVDLVNNTMGELTSFFTDSTPGKGITAKLKRAVREVVRPDALLSAEDTIYPESGVAEPKPSVKTNERKSVPALQPLDDTQAMSKLNDKKTNPPKAFDHNAPTRPLMRRKPSDGTDQL